MLKKTIFNFIKSKIPKISKTELIALRSGNTSIDRQILEGTVKLPFAKKQEYKLKPFMIKELLDSFDNQPNSGPQIRTPVVMNALSITSKFENDVEMETAEVNGRNVTVAWMGPNSENQISFSIVEDLTGEFYSARKMKSPRLCPSLYEDFRAVLPGDLQQPLSPSDFNSFTDCCDFTMIEQGGNVKRLFKNDLYCNETNFADGIEPSYPYQETTMTLCITHGYGDYEAQLLAAKWDEGIPLPESILGTPKTLEEKKQTKVAVAPAKKVTKAPVKKV
mgnify:CR=1 FL=1